MRHPGFRALSDYADDTLSPSNRLRMREHLERCTACCRLLLEIRALDAAAQELSAPQLSSDALERTLARVAAGEVMILPLQDEPTREARRHSTRPRGLAVAAALACLLLVGTLWRGGQLQADAASLHFAPAAPVPGQQVRAQYRASSILANHDVLVLRARVRRPQDGTSEAHYVLARLKRVDEGTYQGTFALPDSVMYAVFAVEDTSASEVDAGGERWELLVHDNTGRPLLESLWQRYADIRFHNPQLTRRAADTLLRVYPRHPQAWFPAYTEAVQGQPQVVRDRLRARYAAQLPSLLPYVDTTSYVHLSATAWYTDALAHSSAGAWREMLLRRHPRSRAAKQLRALALVEGSHRTRGEIQRAAEALWVEWGSDEQSQLVFTMFSSARAWKDVAQLERWGERMIATEGLNPSVIDAYMSTPALRPQGRGYLRRYLRTLENWPDSLRPLSLGSAQQRSAINGWRAQLLAKHAEGLVQIGRREAALDTLQQAIELLWSPDLFRRGAALLVETGDTAAALPLLAYVAADPTTSAAFTDSVRARHPRHFDGPEWSWWLHRGRTRMRAALLAEAVNRPVGGKFVLMSQEGQRTSFDPADERVTVVARWCYTCPPSRQQLPQLDTLARALSARGVRIITISDEDARSSSLASALRGARFSFRYYSDIDGDAERALKDASYPNYTVIDRTGRIRFQGHRPEPVLRQVWVLEN